MTVNIAEANATINELASHLRTGISVASKILM